MMDLATLFFVWGLASLTNATPLILVTLGETLGQRTGVINLGCEGAMLGGACAGFGAAMATGNPWIGMAAGAATGLLFAALHAALVLGARANQLAAGIAVWTLALGLTSYIGRAFVGGKVEALPSLAGTWLTDLPIIGKGLGQLSVATPIAVLLVLAAVWWLERTRTGLSWRVAGESALIATENGMSPTLSRLSAVLVGGCLAGLGGAVLSVDYTQTWANEITKGRGLVAVGLVIVARWNPRLVLPVCLLFGFAETAALRLPAMGVDLSSYVLSALPYAVVLVALVANQITFRPGAAMPADLKRVFQ
ncbi:ABC transporter permease [Pseudooceanicola sp. 216_PA32_1]|uniref:ABC transporter permease n=1 Tax=Pseudooceanicola pacificus TaxID=2676438 RepID=A0A844W370_9RHOB|nr:ABC transporter permease [Pseudooceanicola pacificus]MWB77154.1 ABC transporter permease [Pseudooceanicola pacificus]